MTAFPSQTLHLFGRVVQRRGEAGSPLPLEHPVFNTVVHLVLLVEVTSSCTPYGLRQLIPPHSRWVSFRVSARVIGIMSRRS